MDYTVPIYTSTSIKQLVKIVMTSCHIPVYSDICQRDRWFIRKATLIYSKILLLGLGSEKIAGTEHQGALSWVHPCSH